MREDLKLDSIYDGFIFLAESARNPPSLKSHHHAELEINLVTSGSLIYLVRSRRYVFGPRTLLWMFPSQEHQLIDRTKDAKNYVAVFKPELIARSCHAEKYQSLKRKKTEGDRVLHTVLDPDTFSFLRQVMERMMVGSIDPDILNREAGFGVNSDFRYQHADSDMLNAGLHYLLMLCWRLQSGGESSNAAMALHPAVSKAIMLLSENRWEGALGELARICGLSEAHMSRIFARQIGVPLNRYRNSLRLARFWECYQQPVRPTILEAAYSAGFGSYAQFYKVFTEAYNRNPRACLKPE